MLIEFSVGNYKSFKGIQTLHLQASQLKSKDNELEENNTFQANDRFRLLKSKIIYGANDSGKSNLVKAMVAVFNIIQNSFKDDQVIQASIEPFLLSKESKNSPTYFQIAFLLDKIPYRYGMELQDGKVVSEWLFGTPNKREVYYFIREEMSVEVNKTQFKEALKIVPENKNDIPIYGETSLFMSVAAASNRPLAGKIVHYMNSKIGVFTLGSIKYMRSIAFKLIEDENFNSRLIELLNYMDINVRSIARKEVDIFNNDILNGTKIEFADKEMKAIFISKTMNVEAEQSPQYQDFILSLHEAEGTKKLIELAPFLLSALDDGQLLVIDELDARFHPRIVRKIVELFNSKTTNSKNAQLIAVSHDTNLMDARLLRRDQICFVDRDKQQSSYLYSLAEYKGVRNDASYEKDYLKGKYGAVPYVNRVESLFANKLIAEDA